jgi:AcrR family transcriptional regulator
MLNMSSATTPATPTPDARADDRTTRARIRDVAIACFADAGVAATTVRTIATAADVSPALVIHHFGSKDGLRSACDEHVAALIRERKSTAMAQGTGLDPLAALRAQQEGPPVLRYLARTLVDGAPHVADLVDEMVADAVGYMQQGVDTGILRPSDDPHGRAAILTIWSLGAVVLHEHLERLIGVDVTADLAGVDISAYALPALEILGDGLMTPEMVARLRATLADEQART